MAVPVAIALAVAAATLSPNIVLAFTGGFYSGQTPSAAHSESLPFNDVTEQLEFRDEPNDQMLVINPLDDIVVCLIGKSYFSTSPSPSIDGSRRRSRGYNDKKDYIPLNGVSGQWIFMVQANDSRLLHAATVKQIATIQCATVDYTIDNKMCRPGMNIHACVKRGL